jgi:magnesium transporter
MSPESSKKSAVRLEISPKWVDFEVGQKSGTPLLVAEGIPQALVDSALLPGALPKFETDDKTALWLLRAFDAEADRRAQSARDLTRKLAIFIQGDHIVTAHRFPAPHFRTEGLSEPERILAFLLERMIASYTDAIAQSEDVFDAMEASVFGAAGAKTFRLKDAYFLRRRLTVIRKMLFLAVETVDAAATLPVCPKLILKNLRRRMGAAISNTDSLLERVNHLLQLHIAFLSQRTNESSQRTNEVMRVLTVFSAFFLPLSFIAGIYGMNFQHMPELGHRAGYPATLALMAGVALAIGLWFWKKGWIGKR